MYFYARYWWTYCKTENRINHLYSMEIYVISTFSSKKITFLNCLNELGKLGTAFLEEDGTFYYPPIDYSMILHLHSRVIGILKRSLDIFSNAHVLL
jgi:hypothetical protein